MVQIQLNREFPCDPFVICHSQSVPSEFPSGRTAPCARRRAPLGIHIGEDALAEGVVNELLLRCFSSLANSADKFFRKQAAAPSLIQQLHHNTGHLL